jgi:acetoin utilization deacetylase AcuC-like enzyme
VATLLLDHPLFTEHLVPPGHPERPERLLAIRERLRAPAFSALLRENAPRAELGAILAVHSENHVERIRGAAPATGLAMIDGDTAVSARSFEAALHAAGAVTTAVDAAFEGRAANAFCAVRPPGHHAEPEIAMGFCLFNNAAIGARYAQRRHGAERVAIVDWDVHHGNGSQAAFWSDPSVLYASTHEMPLYPYTGAASDTGAGNIVNVPLRAGTRGPEFRELFQSRIVAAVDAFRPDLLVISAGFDAHWRDPLADLALNEDDFAFATMRLREAAERWCDGRIVSVLEGGYDLEGLAESVAAHVSALME